MATPALVVGIGGTGEGILSHLKRSLSQSHGGQMPPEVKLLHIDTDARAVENAAQARPEVSYAVAGGFLEPHEVIKVGGNVRDLATEIAAERHPELQWFRANEYLNALPPGMFYLHDGAGQFRQFGRMALFYDLRMGGGSLVRAKLGEALADLQRRVHGQYIHAILVGSLAGGTGAGMFVDVAYLIRTIGAANALSVTLRGVLLLPRVFASTPAFKPEMVARAAAAMRENQRFTTAFKWDTGYPMEYVGPGTADSALRGRIRESLFDHLYYFDGNSAQMNLTQHHPGVAHFPMVAETLVSVLDDQQAGQAFVAHTANVQAYRTNQGLTNRPVCGGIGAFTLALPVHHLVEEFSARLGLETLDLLLQPAAREGQTADGVPATLAPNRNLEAGEGIQGRAAVTPFLATDSLPDRDGSQFQNTGFTQQIVRDIEQFQATNQAHLDALAGRGIDWLRPFTPEGSSADIQTVQSDVALVVSAQVPQHAPPPRVTGAHPRDAVRTVTGQVRQLETDHFGVVDTEGRSAGGQYQRALERYSGIHVTRFSRMLSLYVGRLLNGQAPGPLESRSGKLGYAADFLEGLVADLGRFHALMAGVRTRRTVLRRTANARASFLAAEADLQREAVKRDDWMIYGAGVGAGLATVLVVLTVTLVVGVETLMAGLLSTVAGLVAAAAAGFAMAASSLPYRSAHAAYERYLAAAQDYQEQLRVDALLHTIEQTASEVQRRAAAARDEAQNWTAALAHGQPHGLYRQVRQARAEAVNSRAQDDQLQAVRELVRDAVYENNLYRQYAKAGGGGPSQAALDLLDQFTWEAQTTEDGNLALGLSLAGLKLEAIGRGNRDALLSACRRSFAALPAQVRMADYLINHKGYTPQQFGTQLAGRVAGPLLSFDPMRAGSPLQYNFLRIQHDGPETIWCNSVVTQVAAVTGTPAANISVLQSADPHVCTLIFTTDLIPLDAVTEYRQGIAAYIGYQDQYLQRDRRVLHVFQAEQNAVAYEQRLGELQRPVEALHNDVVLQLEYPERFERFARAWAEGLVQERATGPTEHYYTLVVPGGEIWDKDGEAAGEMEIHLSATDRAPSLLEALETYVYRGQDYRGADGRSGVQIPLPYGQVEQIVNDRRALPPLSDKKQRAEALRGLISRNQEFLRTRVRPLTQQAQDHPVERDLGAALFFYYRDEIAGWNREITQSLS